MEVDIAIIGGGLTGSIAAYLLRERGPSVAVIEKSSLGQGDTGRTTAFLMSVIDTDPAELISIFGEETARLVLHAHRDAIDFFERTASEERIECAFTRCPAYTYGQTESDAASLQKQADALQTLGIEAEFHTDGGLPVRNEGYLQVNQQAKYHPLQFQYALNRLAERQGVRFFEQTEVLDVESGSPHVLKTPQGTVHATHVLSATHHPFPQPAKLLLKKAWYTTYMLESTLPKGRLPEALYLDSHAPYHFSRIDPHDEMRDRLIIGGEDHRSDLPVDANKSFAALENHLRREFLPDTQLDITRRWRGGIVEPSDGLAYIGPVEEDGIFYATGHSGNGMTHAVIAAHLFADYVKGIRTPLADIFAADRAAPLRAYWHKGLDYARELWGGAVKNTFMSQSHDEDHVTSPK